MAIRKVIKICEEKCDGCGLCMPNCPEGAIQIIDGKARLVSDIFCDGLGACLGHCPKGAITIEEREAEEYDEKKVMGNIAKQGGNVIKAHLEHLKMHGQHEYLKEAMDFLRSHDMKIGESSPAHAHEHPGGCPGSKVIDLGKRESSPVKRTGSVKAESELRQWPVQIMLAPVSAPYFKDADLLIAADCVPFAYAAFHEDILKGRMLLIGCPKLDDAAYYKEKLTQIFKNNNIRSVAYAHMEVPCCFGLTSIIKEAMAVAGKKMPFNEIVISVKGDRLNDI